MTTRRDFLVDCSTVVAALALTPLSLVGRPAMTGGRFLSLEQLSYPILAGQIGTPFHVRIAPGQIVELKLIKAPLAPPTPWIAGRRPPGDAGNEKFSLIFSGPRDKVLAAAIHRFEHPQLGQFEMYIGQIGARFVDGVRYEAGFNRPARAVTPSANLTQENNAT